MKKIILSVFAIVLTIGIVSGSAYAMFTDTASISGVVLGTSTPELLVSNGNGYQQNVVSVETFNGLFPGDSRTTTWYLKNDGTTPLDITGKLVNALTDWPALNIITMRAVGNSIDTTPKSFADWNSGAISLGTLAPGGEASFVITFGLPLSAPDSTKGKSLTDVTFDFVGSVGTL